MLDLPCFMVYLESWEGCYRWQVTAWCCSLCQDFFDIIFTFYVKFWIKLHQTAVENNRHICTLMKPYQKHSVWMRKITSCCFQTVNRKSAAECVNGADSICSFRKHLPNASKTFPLCQLPGYAPAAVKTPNAPKMKWADGFCWRKCVWTLNITRYLSVCVNHRSTGDTEHV